MLGFTSAFATVYMLPKPLQLKVFAATSFPFVKDIKYAPHSNEYLVYLRDGLADGLPGMQKYLYFSLLDGQSLTEAILDRFEKDVVFFYKETEHPKAAEAQAALDQAKAI